VSVFDLGAILLAYAAIVAAINDRFIRLPRVIALLIGSLALSLCFLAADRLVGGLAIAELSQRRIESAHLPAVLLDGALALLLFAASLQLDLAELRDHALMVAALAVVGVLIATALLTAGAWLLFRLFGMDVPIAWCFALGAILAPTDAVAVESLLKRVALPPGMKTMIAGESLFNDGAAIVVFFAALSALQGESNVVGHGRLAVAFLINCGGGGAIGLACGWLATLVLSQVRDDAVAVTVSLALALGVYRLAALAGCSGPLAVVVCGLVVAGRPIAPGDEAGRRARLVGFWSVVDELLNTLLFLLMGFQILTIDLKDFTLVPVLAIVPLALLARFLSIAPPMMLLKRPLRERMSAIGLMSWVGLRGAVSVALALSLPDGANRGVVTAAAYAVVIATIVVQGLSAVRVTKALYPEPAPGARPVAPADRDA
jgi:CPA1 family monovalent cation:H+ antiporter